MRHRSLCISIVLSITACTTSEDQSADTITPALPMTPAPTTPAATTPAPNTAPVATAPSATPATPETELVVTEHGMGALRAGMTVAEAASAIPGFKVPVRRNRNACMYAANDGLPNGVRVMVDQGRVARVEIIEGSIRTAKGARIGDTEERIKRLYPNQVTVSPHKYTDGHYLTVVPAASADSAYRIIFETDGNKVLRYRAGTRPQVEYVEGCS